MAKKVCPICKEEVEQQTEGVTSCKCNHMFRPSDKDA